MEHLVYCDNVGKAGEKVLDKILAKTKTMVARAAAGRKIPHSRVFAGEMLYFMEKGTAKITARAVVSDVLSHVKLTEEEIDKVFLDNQPKINLSDKQRIRWHSSPKSIIVKSAKTM